MTRALIVLDAQKGIVTAEDFSTQLAHIDRLMDEFNDQEELIVATKQLDSMKGSIIEEGTKGVEVDATIVSKSNVVLEKRSPNAFIETELEDILEERKVDELILTGFNAEYCCLFTSVAAVDRGYDVTFIEDAIGSVNTGDVYEYEELDVTDFIATVLHWSGEISVLNFEEYFEGETNE